MIILTTLAVLVVTWMTLIIYQTYYRKGVDDVIRGVDGMYLGLDSKTNVMVINGVFFLETRMELSVLKEHYRSKVFSNRAYRRFLQVPTQCFDTTQGNAAFYLNIKNWIRIPFFLPEWKYVKNFNMDDHFTEINSVYEFLQEHKKWIPENVKEQFSEKTVKENEDFYLKQILSHLSTKRLDKTKPLWYNYLIHRADGTSIFFTRIHHSLSDGIGLVNYTLKTCEPVNKKPDGHKIQRNRTPRPVSTKKKIARILQNIFFTIAALLYLPLAIAKFYLRPSDSENFLNHAEHLSKHKKVDWLQPTFSLEEVKAVAHKHNATVNDILVTVASLALEKYAEYKKKKSNSIQLVPKVKAFVPVGNLFSSHRSDNLENHFGFIYLPFPLFEKNPMKILNYVKSTMDWLKRFPIDMILSYYLTKLSGDFAPPVALKLASEFFARKCSLVFTNVKGPSEPIQMAGVPIKDICFFVPQAGGRLVTGLSIFSYVNSVSVGVCSHPEIISEPEVFLQYCKDSYKQLEEKTFNTPPEETKTCK